MNIKCNSQTKSSQLNLIAVSANQIAVYTSTQTHVQLFIEARVGTPSTPIKDFLRNR